MTLLAMTTTGRVAVGCEHCAWRYGLVSEAKAEAGYAWHLLLCPGEP
jgi:hypothetical protein